MKIMKIDKIIKTKNKEVSCNGDNSFSHPKVYFNIDPKIGYILCNYCNKKFILVE